MTMYDDLLLTVRIAEQRYIVRRSQVNELRLISSGADLAFPDEHGRDVLCFDLADLFTPYDANRSHQGHALIIHMRRRSVGLLVERVEDVNSQTEMHEVIQPLPPLLAPSLDHAWFGGVLVRDEALLLVLDLRRIAQDILLSQKQQS
jgi:chemotaxis signal transduction protein